MAQRYYLMPIIGSGAFADPRRPKYADTILVGTPWTMRDYGTIALCILIADPSVKVETDLLVNVDVFAFPLGLSGTVDAARLKTLPAALFVPLDWLTGAELWGAVFEDINEFFSVMQRYQGKFADSPFSGGKTLDTIMSLGDAAKVKSCLDELGLASLGVKSGATLRQALVDDIVSVKLTALIIGFFKTIADMLGLRGLVS